MLSMLEKTGDDQILKNLDMRLVSTRKHDMLFCNMKQISFKIIEGFLNH